MFKHVGKIVATIAMDKKERQREFFEAVNASDLSRLAAVVNLAKANAVLEQEVDLNAIDDHQLTALHIAAEKGDADTVKFLLKQKRIDVNGHRRARHGNSVLILAVIHNRTAIIVLLLKRGADVNVQNCYGRTALHYAVRVKNLVSVKILLNAHAKPNIESVFGMTPLALNVAEFPDYKIAEALLKAGADPNFHRQKPESILIDLALNCFSPEQLDLVILLLDYHADLNEINRVSGQTALHIVSLSGYMPLAKLLVERGADLFAKDRMGRTPMDVAVQHRHSSLVEFYSAKTKISDPTVPPPSCGVRTKILASSCPRTVRFSNGGSKSSDVDQELD